MGKFRIVHSAVHAGIAALCYWAFGHLGDIQAVVARIPQFFEYEGFTVPATVAILALLFRVSDNLGNILVEKIPFFSPLLRRVLSGRNFIEGDWPLFVVDMNAERLLYVGFLSISFKNGQIYVYGNDWNPDGTHAMEFEARQSLYKDAQLQYWYEQGPSLHDIKMRGYTEIFFFPVRTLAERHAGKFLDARHTTDIRFYAERKRYRRFQRRLSARDHQLTAAREFWSRYKPRLLELKEKDIRADFV